MKSFTLLILLSIIRKSLTQNHYLEGRLVKIINQPAIWLILDGKRRHIPNPTSFNAIFKNWNTILTRFPQELSIIPTGPPLLNARLIKGSGPAVYLTVDLSKRHIANPRTFNHFNFSWNKIINVSNAVISNLPTGPVIQI